jgi:hypothetical protein
MHGVILRSDSRLLSKIFILLYQGLSLLPKILSEVLKRGLLGIRRRHHAALLRKTEPLLDAPLLEIIVDELFLHYK